jgi:hypothetical protein
MLSASVVNHGELIIKKNNETKEKFYGCTHFSHVSDLSCNISISENDMNNLIKQVNDAIKFQLNLRSTQYDQHDYQIFDKKSHQIQKIK